MKKLTCEVKVKDTEIWKTLPPISMLQDNGMFPRQGRFSFSTGCRIPLTGDNVASGAWALQGRDSLKTEKSQEHPHQSPMRVL